MCVRLDSDGYLKKSARFVVSMERINGGSALSSAPAASRVASVHERPALNIIVPSKHDRDSSSEKLQGSLSRLN